MHAVSFLQVDKREDIMKAAEEFAYYNVDPYENYDRSYHGWLKIHDNIICDSYEKAIEKIENMIKPNNYDDRAVQYRDYSHLKLETSAMKKLKERIVKNSRFEEQYIDNNNVWNRKSKFIGCESCGSKLSIEHLKAKRKNHCPLCSNDLRSKTVLDRIQKFKDDNKKLSKQYDELEKKQQLKKEKKAKIKWCVKVEVHC